MRTSPRQWLLIVHQVPPKPDYLRVKIRRRLADIGCMPLKGAIYVLPDTAACREDLQWVANEIRALGGEAMLGRTSFLEGMNDAELEQQFRDACDAEFAVVTEQASQAIARWIESADAAELRIASRAGLNQNKRKIARIGANDFFNCEGRRIALRRTAELEALLEGQQPAKQVTQIPAPQVMPRARTWVTREGVRVDRMASAWLIRSFIDPQAKFKFVAEMGYLPRKRELRFDMFDGEFTHRGDRCTFEVLLEHFRPQRANLEAVAEIVHDLDLKDGKFGRPQAAGIGQLIQGFCAAHGSDRERIARACVLFDDLLRSFETTPRPRPAARKRKP